MESAISRRSAGRSELRRHRRRLLAALLGGLSALGVAAWPVVVRADDEAEAARRQAVDKIAEAETARAAAERTARHPDYVEGTRRDGEILTALERAHGRLEAAKNALASADTRPSRTGYQDAGMVATGAVREYARFEELTRKALRRIELERRPPPPPPPPPPPRKPPSPPRELIAAADAFGAGDYQGAVEILSGLRPRSREVRAHVHLLRAAARYAIFLLGGETDYALRGEAIEDVLACREADPDLAPVESVFSPRFRRFFEAAR